MKRWQLKRPATLLTILLTSSLTFGQKFQDVTAKGSPLSLNVKIDQTDSQPYVFARNNSSRGVLALTAAIDFTDASGQVAHGFSRADFVFKHGVMASRVERGIMPVESFEPGVKITHAEGAVLFVQFEDGSTWGDPEAGKSMLAARPQKLAFLQHLVEAYYEKGDAGFAAALDEVKPISPEGSVAGCLKADAEYEKVAAIDLAKKRFADALEWRASGIF
jgi:hypothetical protein